MNTEETDNRDIGAVNEELFLQIKQLFAKLTDDERMEVLRDYCKYCGQDEKKHGKCYCAPCYDE